MMETRNMTHNSLRHTRYYLFLVRRIDYNDVDDNFFFDEWILVTCFALNNADGIRYELCWRKSVTQIVKNVTNISSLAPKHFVSQENYGFGDLNELNKFTIWIKFDWTCGLNLW